MKTLIKLLICTSLFSFGEAKASYAWVTGPKAVVTKCEFVEASFQQTSVLIETSILAPAGFTCIEGKNILAAKIKFCKDKVGNNIILGTTISEKDCLLSLLEFIKLIVETGGAVPSIP